MSFALTAASTTIPSRPRSISGPRRRPPRLRRPSFTNPMVDLLLHSVEAGRPYLLDLLGIGLAERLEYALRLQGLLLVDLAACEADRDEHIVARGRTLVAGEEADVHVAADADHVDLGDLTPLVDDLDHLAGYRQAHLRPPPQTRRAPDCAGLRRRSTQPLPPAAPRHPRSARPVTRTGRRRRAPPASRCPPHSRGSEPGPARRTAPPANLRPPS